MDLIHDILNGVKLKKTDLYSWFMSIFEDEGKHEKRRWNKFVSERVHILQRAEELHSESLKLKKLLDDIEEEKAKSPKEIIKSLGKIKIQVIQIAKECTKIIEETVRLSKEYEDYIIREGVVGDLSKLEVIRRELSGISNELKEAIRRIEGRDLRHELIKWIKKVVGTSKIGVSIVLILLGGNNMVSMLPLLLEGISDAILC